MSNWSRFQSQFYETDYERAKRWADKRKARTAAGECWQCAKPIAECECSNLKREATKE